MTWACTVRMALAVPLLAAASCGPAQVGKLRFANQPPVRVVHDRRDVPRQPEERTYPKSFYFADRSFFKLITHRLAVPEPRRAANINAMEEVPDSTWFVNRLGMHDLSPQDVARGPGALGGPDLSSPWQVVGGKTGGTALGLIVKDARGQKYLVKFDERAPVVETAADVVAQRILWAAGYLVPEDSIAYIRRAQLVVAPGAKHKVGGKKRLMTTADLDEILSKVQWNQDGTVRALASRLLDGVPIGGFSNEGVREDDPNDVIPHEHRREIRGLYAFFSWVDQVDVKEDNTLDMWTADAENPRVHYVMHYLVDFGKSLGAMARLNYRPDAGHTYAVDFKYIFKSTPTLGLWQRPWEGTTRPDLRGVGVFDADHFDPDAWKGVTSYAPFLARDDHDMFWAAKIIMRFTPEHIRAAVEQGRYDDPAAAAYVERTLIARQRKIGRYWMGRVNPLDRFAVSQTGTGYSLCFSDLLLAHGLQDVSTGRTVYRAAAFDGGGRPLGWKQRVAPDAAGRGCVRGFRAGRGADSYTIVVLTTQRGGNTLAPVEVHMARDAQTGSLRVVGLNRR